LPLIACQRKLHNCLRDDVQSWNDLQLSLRLRDNIDLLINGTLRLGRHISDPVDERAGVGLLFKINNYLTISPGYLHIFTQTVPGVTRHENRFFLDGTVHFSFKGFVLYDRNMFERRLRQPSMPQSTIFTASMTFVVERDRYFTCQ